MSGTTRNTSRRPERTAARAAGILAVLLLMTGLTTSALAAEYYVSTTGSNSNSGSITSPWRNVDFAIGRLQPGDTLFIRGGTYFETVSASVSGTAASPITIRSYPGERAIIDSGPTQFRTPGNNDWELVNASTGEWRSVQSFSGGRPYAFVDGIPNYQRGRVGLVPYASTSHFRATTDQYNSSAFYVGPGTIDVSGRIHIRLAKTSDMRAMEARYGTVFATENADPRNYSIILSKASTTMTVTGNYLVFRDITFHQASNTIRVDAHHITFDGVTVWSGNRAFSMSGSGVHHIVIRNSRVYGDVPNWIAWSDAKDAPAPADLMRGTMIAMENGAHDVTIEYSHLRGGHDGIGVNDNEYNLVAHHNRIEDFADDGFELEGTTDVGRIEIYENYIGNCLTAIAPGQDSASFTGPLLAYRNVIVLLRNAFVNRAEGINTWNGGGRFGYEYMFKHGGGSSYTTQNTHYYHNTLVMLNSNGKGINITPKFPANVRIANNIMVMVNGKINGTYRSASGTVINGDLYWKVNTVDTEDLLASYDTVAQFNSATGHEANGIGSTPRRGTNPQFLVFNPVVTNPTSTVWTLTAASEMWKPSDFRLQSGSPAIGAGITIPPHPVLGTLPDTRTSRDIGAIPFGATAAEYDIFPFVPDSPPVNDQNPPTVNITAPAAGATLSGTVTIAASASDDLGIAGVTFMANGTAIGPEDTTAPYSISWNTLTVPNGTRTLTAVARDVGNNQTTSSPVNVTISNVDATPPSVSITSPAPGSTVTGTVTISANATDNIGVAGVRFRVDGVDLGAEDTLPPWSIAWDTQASGAGSHILTAIARDLVGNSTTSQAVTVTVGATGGTGTADQIHWTILGQTSVAFNWRASNSTNGARTIEWGTSPGTYTGSALGTLSSPVPSSSVGPFYEAILTGLTEDTTYWYRIAGGSEATFRTPPPRGGSEFWVGAIGDVGSSLNYSNVIPVQQMLAQSNGSYPGVPGSDPLRFIIVNGDLTYGDDKGHAAVDQHFNDVMVWSRDAAYMPSWGNHEWDTGAPCTPGTTSPSGCATGNMNDYEGRFVFPNSKTSPGAPAAGGPGEDWYWFDYGNTRFIVAPEPYSGAISAWETEVTPIMAAAQADPAISFIVTWAHRQTYGSGADHSGDGTSALSRALARLRTANPKLVLHLSAHSHSTEITDPAQTDGIVHLRQPGGGSSQGGLSSTQPSWSVFRINHLTHTRLRFTSTGIEGYIICGPDSSDDSTDCATGEVIHTFLIGSPGGPANQPPNGAINTPATDLTIAMGESVNFTGTASDPDGDTPLTYLWNFGGGAPNSTVEDPGNVIFPSPGTFSVTFTVTDSRGLPDPTPDRRVITVTGPGGSLSWEARVTSGSNDAEEDSGGSVSLTSSDLELVEDGDVQTVGIRFPGVPIPQGATILNAWVQFKVDETTTVATALTLRAESSNSAPAFSTGSGDLSTRPRTSASVAWSPPSWTTVGAAGLDQRTPNLAAILQEVISRPGWVPGNALAIVITGTGKRVAESFEGDAAGAPLLHIDYVGGTIDTDPPLPPTNLRVIP